VNRTDYVLKKLQNLKKLREKDRRGRFSRGNTRKSNRKELSNSRRRR